MDTSKESVASSVTESFCAVTAETTKAGFRLPPPRFNNGTLFFLFDGSFFFLDDKGKDGDDFDGRSFGDELAAVTNDTSVLEMANRSVPTKDIPNLGRIILINKCNKCFLLGGEETLFQLIFWIDLIMVARLRDGKTKGSRICEKRNIKSEQIQ